MLILLISNSNERKDYDRLTKRNQSVFSQFRKIKSLYLIVIYIDLATTLYIFDLRLNEKISIYVLIYNSKYPN